MANPWEHDLVRERVVPVDIGISQTQNLFLSVRGPPRASKQQPVVIVECGAAATSRWWSAVQRLLSPTLRVYCYDRAGLGRSGPALVFPRTAATMAAEMSRLFDAVAVRPPFIIVAHSYGAIIAREYLATLPQDVQTVVVGLVLIDSNQEKTHEQLAVPDHIRALLGRRLNPLIASALDRDHAYTKVEVEAILQEESGTLTGTDTAGHKLSTYRYPEQQSAADSEWQNMRAGGRHLASHGQLQKHTLGANPVTVIRGDAAQDYRRLFDAASTRDPRLLDEARRELASFLSQFAVVDKRLQLEILQLSSNARFVQAKKSGHHVEVTEPELIAAEVERMLGRVIKV